MTFEMKLREREKKGRTEGLDEGLKQGAKDAKVETAKIALQNNLDLTMIQTLTGLSITEVEKLKQEIDVIA